MVRHGTRGKQEDMSDTPLEDLLELFEAEKKLKYRAIHIAEECNDVTEQLGGWEFVAGVNRCIEIVHREMNK